MWQLTLTLIAIIGGVWAVYRSAAKAREEQMRELDDFCLGDESANVKPLHDERGRLIGFVRERRDG